MFTVEEIELLIEGLTAWENSDQAGAILETMLQSVVQQDQEAAKQEALKVIEKAEEKRKRKHDRTILLQAKLIKLKDKLLAGEAADFLATGES
jgi:hypothetical protein